MFNNVGHPIEGFAILKCEPDQAPCLGVNPPVFG